jgi:hypothetical protein
MDWDLAIERHRVPLLGIVAWLFAKIGLTEGKTVERLSKPLYRFVLSILRPAESAVRRLIVVAARDIVVEPREPRPAKPRTKTSGASKSEAKGEEKGKRKRKRRWLFRLFDPPKRENRAYGRPPKRPQVEPRVHLLGEEPDTRHPFFRGLRQPEPPPAAPPPPPVLEEKIIVEDGTVNARHLCRRLFAVVDALENIPRQAMRLARWQARPVEERRPPRSSPLRSGRPPGFRQRSKHEVDDILKECHWLARSVYPPLDDTS